MTALVLDASVALAWRFQDEVSPGTDALLDRVQDQGAVVPSLWRIEVGNVLLRAERRGRTIVGSVAARLALLGRLPIAADLEGDDRAWHQTLAIARAAPRAASRHRRRGVGRSGAKASSFYAAMSGAERRCAI